MIRRRTNTACRLTGAADAVRKVWWQPENEALKAESAKWPNAESLLSESVNSEAESPEAAQHRAGSSRSHRGRLKESGDERRDGRGERHTGRGCAPQQGDFLFRKAVGAFDHSGQVALARGEFDPRLSGGFCSLGKGVA